MENNKYMRNKNELLNNLKQQIELLRLNCKSYDEGNKIVALQIAATLRTLLHNTARSSSVLNQFLNNYVLSEPTFFSVGKNILEPNTIIRSNLTNYSLKVLSDTEVKTGIIPDLHINTKIPNLPFSEWWERFIVLYWDEYQLSRKDVVLLLANKEGGTHLDPQMPLTLSMLKRNLVTTPRFKINNSEILIQKEPMDYLYASVRAIAEETLITFNKTSLSKYVL